MQTLEDKISLLRHLLKLQIGNNGPFVEPIMKTLEEVFMLIVKDYGIYRSNISALLDALDCEGDESLGYTISLFLSLLEKSNNLKVHNPFGESIVTEDLPEGISKIYSEILEKNLIENNELIFSDILTGFLPDDISMLRGLVNLTISQMHHNCRFDDLGKRSYLDSIHGNCLR